ncbi:hypothetical protein SCAR479_13269 [Seiridium cardinale]|uniref:Uncharacterized protein n=1 Tax=Seiridium cardinale TaxID=138064 RepID=A0ABR2X8M1_9PEZI
MRWPPVITMLGLATGHAFGACPYAGRDLGAGTLASVDNMGHGLSSPVVARRQLDRNRWRRPGTLVSTDSFEDSGVLSLNGTKLAYVSAEGNYTTSIWFKDLTTGVAQNLTDTDATHPDKSAPQGTYRPIWSPDGERLAFSSDRNSEWTGHGDGTGWEHTQTLSVYVVRPDGSDLRQIVSEDGYSLGSPSWSVDDSRILYNRIICEDTYAAHGTASQMEAVANQILSVDVATGNYIVNHTSGDYLKVNQHYVGNSSNIGYFIKGGDEEGINYTTLDASHTAFNLAYLPDPSWSPDGSKLGQRLGLRFMDVFPQLNNATSRMAITQKQLGNSSVILSSTHYTDLVDVYATGNSTEFGYIETGLSGAFQPTFSPDGTRIVYHLWNRTSDSTLGLQILDLTSGEITRLTDGQLDMGVRQPVVDDRFDIMTIRPDGTDLNRVTNSMINDAHAV